MQSPQTLNARVEYCGPAARASKRQKRSSRPFRKRDIQAIGEGHKASSHAVRISILRLEEARHDVWDRISG